MKILVFLLLSLAFAFKGYNQSTLPLQADTVVIQKIGGNSNLKLKDATKDSIGGVAYNFGGGLFRFKKSRKITDTSFTIGGDTIRLSFSSVTANNGLTKTGNNIKLGGPLVNNTDIDAGPYDFILHGTGNYTIRNQSGAFQANSSVSSSSASLTANSSATNLFSEVNATAAAATLNAGNNTTFYNNLTVGGSDISLSTNHNISPKKAIFDTNGQWQWDQYVGSNFETIDTSYKSLVVNSSGIIYKRAGFNSTDTNKVKQISNRRTGVLPTIYPNGTFTVDTAGKLLNAEAVRNNMGSFNGVTDTTAFGKSAAYFDITKSQALITPSNPLLQGGAKDLTFAAWVKPTTIPSTNMVIVAKDDNRTKRGSEYLLGYVAFGTNKFQWQIEECCHAAPNDGTTWLIASSTPTPAAGQWYFVVGQYDHSGGKIKIWVNMVKDSLTGVPNLSNTTLTPFTIGGLSDDYDTTGLPECCSFWNGAIKSVGFWNRVLDSTELAYLYNNTVANLPPPGINPATMLGGPSFVSDVPSALSGYTYSVDYDGSNDRSLFSSAVSMPAGSSSVSLWFKADNFGGMVIGRFASSEAYIRVLNSTTIRVQTNVVGTFKDYTVPSMSTGTWYNLIITRGASNLTHVYLNGTESSSGGQTQTDALALDEIAWYWDGSFTALNFDGKVSDVRFYGSTLSGADITALQTNAATSATPGTWYKLNEGTGTTNFDYGTAPVPHPFEYSELTNLYTFEPPKTFVSWWDLSESEGVRYDARLRNIIRDSSITNLLVDISRQKQVIYGYTGTNKGLDLKASSNVSTTTGADVRLFGGNTTKPGLTVFNSGKSSFGDSLEFDNLSFVTPTNAYQFGIRRNDGVSLMDFQSDNSANQYISGYGAMTITSNNFNPISLFPSTGVTIGPARSTSFKLDVLENTTNRTTTAIAGYFAMTGSTYNTSGDTAYPYAIYALADGARVAGSNPLRNVALFGRAINGQQNYSLWLDSGKVKLKDISTPPSTYNILVHGSDSDLYQIPVSSIAANNIYNSDGSIPASTTRTITGSSAADIVFAGTKNSAPFVSITNGGTTSTAIYANGVGTSVDAQTTNGTGVSGYSTNGVGINATSDASEALLARSNATGGFRAARLQSVPTSTNTDQEVLRIERGVNGSPGADGIGGSIHYYNKASDNTSVPSTILTSKLTTATVGSYVSQFSIKGYNSASVGTIATFDGNGNATFGTTNSIVGTTGNESATAGNIGERFSSTTSTYTNFTTTATYQAIDSITLTAGNWDLSAIVTLSTNGATITAASDAIFAISTTRASASGATEGMSIFYVPQAALLGTSHESASIPAFEVKLTSPTKYYLNGQATFTLGNPQYVGTIRAIRTR